MERICERPIPLCERMEPFFQLVAEMARAKDLQETMKILLRGASEILEIKRSCIFTTGDNENEMVLSHGYPENVHTIGLRLKFPENPNLWHTVREETVFLFKPNGKREYDFYRNNRINSVLFIRLVLTDETIGIWALDATEEKYDFSPEEIKIATAISYLMMNAIQHYREIEKDAQLKMLGEAEISMAHELKNPLVGAGGFVRRTEKQLKALFSEMTSLSENEKIKAEKIQETVELALKDIVRMETLINNIAVFTEPNNLINPAPNDLNAIVETVVSEKKIELDAKGLPIQISFTRTEIPILSLDKKQIEIAVNETIQNALDAIIFSAKGTIPNEEKIFLRTYKKENEIRLEIKNTGSYIKEEDYIKIFSPFFTTHKTAGGWGLGLSIVRKIIESHDAKISVKSRENPPETTFVIKFKIPH